MKLEIVSPEAQLFSGEVLSVTVPGALGSFQILNNHAPIVSTLIQGRIKIQGKIIVFEAKSLINKKLDENYAYSISNIPKN